MTRARLAGIGTVVATAMALVLPASSPAAVYTVTIQGDTTAFDSQCSLREAVSAANSDGSGPSGDCPPSGTPGADTINVPASGSDYVLTGAAGDNANASGDIDILSNLTISGAGLASTTINANQVDRVFHVVGNRTVEIRDVTVTAGLAPAGADGPAGTDQAALSGIPSLGQPGTDGTDGGGIYNEGTLTLTRVSVRGNSSGGGGGGGNGGQGGSGADEDNGGVSYGGDGGDGGKGGGVMNSGTLSLVDSTITQNAAGAGGDGGDAGAGGAGGPAFVGYPGGDSAGGIAGDGGPGGGIFSSGGTVNVTNSVISQNNAGASGFGGDGGTAGDGGGDTSTNGGPGGNSAGGQGSLGGSGGGISMESTALTLTDSTVRDNFAGLGGRGGNGGTSGAGGVGASFPGAGGSASGAPGGSGGNNAGIDALAGSQNISRSTVSGNTAGAGGPGGAGGAGGSGSPSGNSTGAPGGAGGNTGGLEQVGSGTVTVTNATIASNRAGSGGAGGAGGSGPVNSTGGNGGNGGGRAGVAAGTAFDVRHATIASNLTGPGGNAGGAGTGSNPTAGSAGSAGAVGGIAIRAGGSLTLRNGIVASNSPNQCVGVFEPASARNLEFPDNSSCPDPIFGDPLLGLLQSNGGPTFTMALGAGSPALNRVPSSGAFCELTDQRGTSRPQGSACDLGAFEREPPSSGAPGGGGPGGAPPSEFAGLTIAAGSVRVDSKRRAPIKVSCPADAVQTCGGTLSMSATVTVLTKSVASQTRRRRRTVKLGRATVSVAPGTTAVVRIKLPKAGFRLLGKSKKLKATLTAVTHDARNQNKTTTRKITLRAPKKRRSS